MAIVPRLWPGATVAILGAGPSLTREDVAAVRARLHVIAINKSYELGADVMYACDGKFWDWEQGAPSFTGPKYSIDPAAAKWPGVEILTNTGPLDLELDPAGLRTGKNSGYQAINLAVHLGAARILLLGYDMGESSDGRTHWHGDHPDGQPSPYWAMLEAFPFIVEPLAAIGVTVINCSRHTRLTTFPCAPLADELARLAVAA